MKQQMKDLTVAPHKSKAKMMTICWIITQFFVLLFGITALVDAGQEQNPGLGFQAIWMMLLSILLATFGSLILLKPEQWQTPLSYGMFVGASVMMCNWMLCMAAVAGGTDFAATVGGCDKNSPSRARSACIDQCKANYTLPGDSLVASGVDAAVEATGWDKLCVLAMTRRAVVAMAVFLFLCYLVDAVMLVVFRKDIMQAKAAPASEEPQAIGANAAAYGQPAANAV